MGRRCTVCDHPKRAEIDRALVDNDAGYRTVASRFGIAPGAAFRHRKKHLPELLARALAARPVPVVRAGRKDPATPAYDQEIAAHHEAVEERHEFPHASGGSLLARVTYEDRYADGELVQTERVRLRCDVEKLADAASIHASLGGKAALIHCQEEREPGGRSTGPKHPDTYSYEKVRYSHWYVLDSGWSIPLEGEWTLRVNEVAHARKWRSKLLSFEAGS